MYVRLVTIKCPNETAKSALKLLNKKVANEQMKTGLLNETVIDLSDNSFIAIKYWISESHFEKGRKNWQKMSQEFNEMGAKVTGVGGEAETMYTDSFKDYI
jgi:hypothetical protein